MAAAWARAALVVLAVVVVDQVAKALVVDSVERGESRDIALGVDLVHVRNNGIAFGLFDGGGTVLTVLIVAALVLLVGYFATHADRPLLWLATGLLLGGALGNLVDRMVREPGLGRGHVVDFIAYGHLFIGNVADIAIVAAAVLMALLSVRGTAVDGSRLPPRSGPREDARG
jgi:signal peptidase II